MAHHHIVVLGAGFAGLSAAKRAARQLRGTPARITLVNATGHFVERTRLHQVAAGRRVQRIRLAELLHGTGIEPVIARVTGIDPETRTVVLEDPHPDLSYDTLVYALGSSVDTRGVPGVAEHAFAVADTGYATRLRDHLADRIGSGAEADSAASAGLPVGANAAGGGGTGPTAVAFRADSAPTAPGSGAERHRIAVVGGGLTGLEAATELAESHPRARVELATSGQVGDWLQPRALRHLNRALDRLGVAVREHTAITAVEAGRALVEGGEPIGFDTLVWATGFRVHTLAAEAGLAVDGSGRLLVDESLRSLSHPEVIGAGDAAAAATPGGVARMTCQTGLPMGLQVGNVIADTVRGRSPRPVRVRHVAAHISLGRRDGISQFLRADDTPVRAVLTGGASTKLKEAILRGTVSVLRHPGPYLPRMR